MRKTTQLRCSIRHDLQECKHSNMYRLIECAKKLHLGGLETQAINNGGKKLSSGISNLAPCPSNCVEGDKSGDKNCTSPYTFSVQRQ